MILLTSTFFFALLALMATAVRRVPVGQVHSLYRRGKPVRLLQPGTHVVVPWVDRVGHRIDLGGRTLSFDASMAETKPLHGTVYWQVLEPERADAVIEHCDQLIRTSVVDALHAEPEAAPEERIEVAARLKSNLNKHLRARGVMVTRIELEAA